jgi:predicted RNA binding protein YcfA (HicA-like mRNA interferase family)
MMHTGRELMRLIERAGFVLVHQRGSHRKMRHPDGRQLVFNYERTGYPKGSYYRILRQAGLLEAVRR